MIVKFGGAAYFSGMRKPRPGRATYYSGVSWRECPPEDGYPFSIPAVRNLEELRFDSPVTFLVGENGSGKSTLIEAIAINAGFNPEGGSRNFRFATRESQSELASAIRLDPGGSRVTDGYFLRAESFYNLATNLEELDEGPDGGQPLTAAYGGKSLHEQSHGEAFFSLLNNRLNGGGFYVFDEPEAALSPQRQLAMLVLMHRLVLHRAQMVIATHSPILLAYPEATIYQLDEDGMRPIAYEETDHYILTRRFLNDREGMVEKLIREEEDWFGGTRR